MDWTSVAIFHHAHQELLLGLFQRATNSTNLEKTSTASLTANNQHTKIQIVFQGLLSFLYLLSDSESLRLAFFRYIQGTAASCKQ